MSKITLNNLANLQNETTAVVAINANNTTLTETLDNMLSRDGTSPNQMNSVLDMNSNRILNLVTPNSDQEPVTLGYLTDQLATIVAGTGGTVDLTGALAPLSVTTANVYGGITGTSTLALKGTSSGTHTTDKVTIDGTQLLINTPAEGTATSTNSTVSIRLNGAVTSLMSVEGKTPNINLIDTTGKGGGSIASHSANINVSAYDSAGTYWDSAIRINPGWAYSDAGHMQSDIDISGYFDGKGLLGCLGYSTGSTTVGNNQAIQNPVFQPVPDSIRPNLPTNHFGNGVVIPQSITATANSGGKLRLTVPNNTSFTGQMYVVVRGVNGTTEANGKHYTTIPASDTVHIDLEDATFANALTSVTFAGYITNDGTFNTLTVTSVSAGTIKVGQNITGTGIPSNTNIVTLGTGTGSTGTYILNTTSPLLTVASFGSPETISAFGTVAVLNPTDLGSLVHSWNDFYLGGDIYQGMGGTFIPSSAGYRVFAMNSLNQDQALGCMIRQYLKDVELVRITSTTSGVSFNTYSTNAGFAFVANTNGTPGNFGMSAQGGLGVGTLSDPGAGYIYINGATWLLRNKTTWTNNSGALTGTLTNSPKTGNPTKWIAVDDNGTTRLIPAW